MRHLLGSILLAMAFCAVAAAADPTGEEAVALLAKLKARATPPKDPDKIMRIDFGRKPVTNDNLKIIGVLKNVRELNLGGPYSKEPSKDKKDKDKIRFAAKQINDDGVKAIAGMTELVKLELDGTNVTDAGLKHLAGMTKLKELVLSSTKVTDAGMEELTKLPSLETVTLFDTKVTDVGETTLKRWKLSLKINR